MAKQKTQNRHYVNNKEFLEAMTEYRTARVEAEERGDDHPVCQTILVSVSLRLQIT